MNTVDDVVALIKSEYPHMIEINPHHFWGTWNLWEGRQQNLHIEIKGANVVYSSPFATVDQITAEQALNIAQETIFGVVFSEPHFMLRHTSPFANLDKNELQEDVMSIAGIADYLEAQVSGRDIQ